jgi:hypothetical protein
MAWIRLSDNYQDDEKIHALSNGAFRLWHEGIAYCRRNSTDGLIPFSIMKGFKSFTKRREKELSLPHRDGLAPLWHLVPAMGYRMHNFLKYNLSREEESDKRSASKARMRKFRASGDALHAKASDAEVLGMGMDLSISSERESERKPDPFVHEKTTNRAAAFLDRYQALYPTHRKGARYALKPVRDYAAAVTLCHTWQDDARLDKLAIIFLTTDHKFAEEGSRTVPQFLALSSWCDSRLCDYEAKKASA